MSFSTAFGNFVQELCSKQEPEEGRIVSGGAPPGYDSMYYGTSTYPLNMLVTTATSGYYATERIKKVETLYLVFMVDGTNRKNPNIQQKFVIAKDADEAKLFAGFDTTDIDKDFLTIYASGLCPVKIKPRPTEIKTVVED